MELLNGDTDSEKKSSSRNYKSAALSRRNSRKRKGFAKKKQVDVDFTVARSAVVDVVDDTQPVDEPVFEEAVVLESNVSMDDIHVNNDNDLLSLEPVSVPVSVLVQAADVPVSVLVQAADVPVFVLVQAADVPVSVLVQASDDDVPVAVKTGKHKRYLDLVNRSKMKLNSSQFQQNVNKSRRLQRKIDVTKKLGVRKADGYKLIDVNLLKKTLSQCCICRYCKNKEGKD